MAHRIGVRRIHKREWNFFDEINSLLGQLPERDGGGSTTPIKLGEVLQNPDFFLFAALFTESGKQRLVGIASLSFFPHLTNLKAKIGHVAIDPAFNRAEIEERLMEMIFLKAQKRADKKCEAVEITLRSTLKGRVGRKVHEMYKSTGFTIVARTRGKNGSSFYRMTVHPREESPYQTPSASPTLYV